MTVSTIATIAAGLSRALGNQGAKVSSVFSNLLQSQRPSPAFDASGLTAAITLQNKIAQFRIASQDVAQAGTLLSAAETGINEISRQLARLRDLAQRAASPSLSAQDRALLDSEFQAIRNRINNIAGSTRFNGELLLDGSASQLRIAGSQAASEKDLSVGSFSDAVLFANKELNISTAEGAKATEAAVKAAITYADTQRTNVVTLQNGVELAAATLQSAIQNQEAANSSLDDSDFTLELFGISRSQGVGADSIAAQTNRLPNHLIQLLSE